MAPPTTAQARRESASAADELTPLLGSMAQDPENRTNEAEVIGTGAKARDEEAERPLPMGQIFVLCMARLVDPICFFSIFPFLPAMVASMNVKEVDVGFWTGLIVR